MRKLILLVALVLMAGLALTACNKKAAEPAADAAAAAPVKPTDPGDTKGWNAYLGPIVVKNMEGMTAAQPFAYMVKAPINDEAKADNARQLEAVQEVVSRGVTGGNLLAFAGPDSTATADLLISAFQAAKPNSLKNVIVLFVGDQADESRVSDAVKPTGATFRFVQI
ncbi:MAG: hypothetical protein J0H50_11580 [Xanthomonadales bacterium]|nr:hypothetical protein [Xanthomonadales bacterium]